MRSLQDELKEQAEASGQSSQNIVMKQETASGVLSSGQATDAGQVESEVHNSS